MEKATIRLLYFIPARSGSKGIPDKNIRNLCGKPLLSYAIHSCLESEHPGRVFVSTDSEKYASIARFYGAEVPFLRPQELAGDTSRVSDAISDALQKYETSGVTFDAIVLVQPTSPLILPHDISRIIDIFLRKNANAIVSVTENDCPKEWINHLPSDFSLHDFLEPETALKNRQELATSFRITGCIRVIKTAFFLKYGPDWYGSECYASILPRERSLDIDNDFDWRLTEFIMHDRKISDCHAE